VRARGPHSTGLLAEVRRSHRLVRCVLLAALVLSLVTAGYVVAVSTPRLSAASAQLADARALDTGMLEEEAGIRAWLTTGDQSALQTYDAGHAVSQGAVARLVRHHDQHPSGTPEVVTTLLAQQRWDAWAAIAATSTYTSTQRSDGTAARFMLEADAVFDTYRDAADASNAALARARSRAETQQADVLRGVLAAAAVLLALAALATAVRQRRSRRTLVEPLDSLHDTVTALRSGDLTVRTGASVAGSVPELAEVGVALDTLADDLTRAGTEAAARERRLARLAYRFETVVRVGREVAGSLSVPYVSATVTTAAAELLNASAVLWLRGEQQTFEAVHRSRDPHGVNPPADPVPPGIVARAAADAHVASELGRTAYPLVLAGRVTAVLEVATTQLDADTDQVLSALLSTAAASLESAHLHSTARQMADLDGLTSLPNRRRFETDMDSEWERCRRYKRPLSLVMLDLDHFKRLNDEHGHLLGDEVLREVARTLRSGLRATDTAYRYGGEELVVLLRETRLQEATAVAERLRGSIAGVRLVSHPEVSVSASAGVSTLRTSMPHHTDLVGDADRALYEAKRLGRDRVVTTPTPGETLVHGGPTGSLVPDQVIPQ